MLNPRTIIYNDSSTVTYLHTRKSFKRSSKLTHSKDELIPSDYIFYKFHNRHQNKNPELRKITEVYWQNLRQTDLFKFVFPVWTKF